MKSIKLFTVLSLFITECFATNALILSETGGVPVARARAIAVSGIPFGYGGETTDAVDIFVATTQGILPGKYLLLAGNLSWDKAIMPKVSFNDVVACPVQNTEKVLAIAVGNQGIIYRLELYDNKWTATQIKPVGGEQDIDWTSVACTQDNYGLLVAAAGNGHASADSADDTADHAYLKTFLIQKEDVKVRSDKIGSIRIGSDREINTASENNLVQSVSFAPSDATVRTSEPALLLTTYSNAYVSYDRGAFFNKTPAAIRKYITTADKLHHVAGFQAVWKDSVSAGGTFTNDDVLFLGAVNVLRDSKDVNTGNSILEFYSYFYDGKFKMNAQALDLNPEPEVGSSRITNITGVACNNQTDMKKHECLIALMNVGIDPKFIVYNTDTNKVIGSGGGMIHIKDIHQDSIVSAIATVPYTTDSLVFMLGADGAFGIYNFDNRKYKQLKKVPL